MNFVGKARLIGSFWLTKAPNRIAQRLQTAQVRHISQWQSRINKLDALFISGITRFHEISGYAHIEQLKTRIGDLDKKISSARQQVRDTRAQYTDCLLLRQTKQKEINELLMRKQAWQPADLERFTQLYKDDHQIQQDVKEAKEVYERSEHDLEELQMTLSKLTSARYREEQLWSDKIRQASTWGTLVLMGVNLLLFIVVQLFLEPWKRRRMLNGFEKKVETMFNEHEAALKLNSSTASTADVQCTEGSQTVQTVQTTGTTEITEGVQGAQSNMGPELSWNNLTQRLTQKPVILTSEELLAMAGGLVLLTGVIVKISTN